MIFMEELKLKGCKIGVMVDSLRMPFNEGLKFCADMGANGVQIYAVDGEFSPENMTDGDLRQKKNLLCEYGLEVSALCGDLGGYGFAKREDNPAKIERSKRIVDLAIAFGTNIVTTHIGVIPADVNSDTYKIMKEACNELAEYAYKNKCYFAIETGPEPAKRLKSFLDSLDSRGIAINLDPANLVMVTDDDPVQAVYTLKDYIVHTHVKDGIMLKKTDPKIIYDFFAEGGIGDLRLDEYFKETPLGQGRVNFNKYFSALREIGYNGYLTVEREVGECPERDIKIAVDYIKTALKE